MRDFPNRRRSELIAVITWLGASVAFGVAGNVFVVSGWKKYSVDRACVVLREPESAAYSYAIVSFSGGTTTPSDFEEISELPVRQIVIEFYTTGGVLKQSAILDAKTLVTERPSVSSVNARWDAIVSAGQSWPLGLVITQDVIQDWLQGESGESKQQLEIEAKEIYILLNKVAELTSFPMPGYDSEVLIDIKTSTLSSFNESEVVLDRSYVDIDVESRVPAITVLFFSITVMLTILGLLILRLVWRRRILSFGEEKGRIG